MPWGLENSSFLIYLLCGFEESSLLSPSLSLPIGKMEITLAQSDSRGWSKMMDWKCLQTEVVMMTSRAGKTLPPQIPSPCLSLPSLYPSCFCQHGTPSFSSQTEIEKCPHTHTYTHTHTCARARTQRKAFFLIPRPETPSPAPPVSGPDPASQPHSRGLWGTGEGFSCDNRGFHEQGTNISGQSQPGTGGAARPLASSSKAS